MPLSIDWPTGVITVPQADLVALGGGEYELDVDTFRRALLDLEDDEEGMPWPRTHRHNTEVTIGGVTYARLVELINGYTVTFEDGQYAVNLTGANNNIADVTNINQVSVRSNNSAGLVSTATPADIAAEVMAQLQAAGAGSAQQVRDALTLPATASPQAGSVDTKIDNTFASVWAR